MIRVVLDTNVVVSALMRPFGIPARILQLAYSGSVEVCMSGELFGEYEDVLSRPRLKIPADSVRDLAAWLKQRAEWVEPKEVVVGACSDPDDDIVLACAAQGRADFVITGNVIDFPRQWGETLVVTPRGFVDSLQVEGRRVEGSLPPV